MVFWADQAFLYGRSEVKLSNTSQIDARFHQLPLVRFQPARLEQNTVGNANLTDIVHRYRQQDIKTAQAPPRVMMAKLMSYREIMSSLN